MSLFENFPYTNLHELNLDWLIQEMKELEQKVQDGPVISVNGQTGEVILYRQPNVQLPDITDPTVTTWEIFRYLNGHIYGIQFDSNNNVYALKDYARTKLLTWNDIPPEAGVISVNGLYGVVHLSGTDIPYMGGETETLFDKWSEMDDAITALQTVDNAIKSGMVYFEAEDTAVNNIAPGKYVFWKNDAYIASTAISAGDTLSTTNLTAVGAGGIINSLKADLKNQIDTLSNKFPAIDSIITGAVAGNTTVYLSTGVNKHCLLFIQRRDAGGGIYGVDGAIVTPYITISDMVVELYNNNTEVRLINSSSVTRTYTLFTLSAV